ncbi:hypothetical protein NC652_001971 [Populus alba x Populus x berolinensis]|nr:hypothetical protein NC652_001971 [Populus alba x Populus x berolinensis]
MVIASHPMPSNMMGMNNMYWKASSRGQFTIKIAYKHQATNELHGTLGDPTWRMVWKCEGPERIKSFLCLMAHNSLLTNERKVARNWSDNPYCHLCQSKVEDTTHIL